MIKKILYVVYSMLEFSLVSKRTALLKINLRQSLSTNVNIYSRISLTRLKRLRNPDWIVWIIICFCTFQSLKKDSKQNYTLKKINFFAFYIKQKLIVMIASNEYSKNMLYVKITYCIGITVVKTDIFYNINIECLWRSIF